MTSQDRDKTDTTSGPTTVAIRNFEGQLMRLRSGKITDDEFRPNRTILGVYGQRQPEEYMVRVRIPFGDLTATQMRCLAEVAREHGAGVGHVTTRVNMQLHWMKLEEMPEVLWKLANVGLTTLQSGGNSVRTVATCPLAGVCAKQLFDVTPYANQLEDRYVGNQEVMQLPRKFKIALSGCPNDCAYSAIQDFGLVAAIRGENGATQKGFQIYVAGGLGVFPRPAELFEDFVPAEEILPTCEALVRLFSKLGDRKNKQKARLKFVMHSLGIEEFRRLVREELEGLRAETMLRTPVAGLEEETHSPNSQQHGDVADSGDPDFQKWCSWNLAEQLQQDYAAVFIPLHLGNITSEQMEVVADLADRFTGATIRTSQQQDLVLRGIPRNALSEVYAALRSVGLVSLRVSGITDVTSCPGTSACSLGITASRGLAQQLVRTLEDGGFQDDEEVANLRIKISGCPDACGHHYLADIGFYGCAVHASGRLYPAYQLVLGGEVTERGTRFAKPVIKLPARSVPEATLRLLDFYKSNRKADERFSCFVDRLGVQAFHRLLVDFTEVPSPRDNISNFMDWDSTRMYILERGEGECAV